MENGLKKELYKVAGFIAGLLVAAQVAVGFLRPVLFGDTVVHSSDPKLIEQVVGIMNEQTKIQAQNLQLLTDLKGLIEANQAAIEKNRVYNEDEMKALNSILREVQDAEKMGEALHEERMKKKGGG